MAGSLNRVSLIGNIGKDPEIKTTQGGTRIANLTLATSESWTDKGSGERKERTEWHRIVIWNPGLIGVIEKYVHKGSKIFIEGSLQTRKWTAQDGSDRYSTEVVLSGFEGQLILLSRDDKGGSSRSDTQTARQPDRTDPKGNPQWGGSTGGGGYDDSEIPF